MASDGDLLDFEEQLVKKHKLENKQLQAEIQKLKHAVPKGDKKRKKEITVEIAKLQAEQDARHEKELAELESSDQQVTETTESLARVSLTEDGDTSNQSNDITASAETGASKGKKQSKAQKRRDKKALQDREREERIQQQATENLTGPRHTEAVKMKALLSDRSLAINQIPSDGNCLYAALVDQLSRENINSSVDILRLQAADYMRQNQDDFMPFLCNHDTGDPYTTEEYEEYCHKLEQTAEWGGQLELRALSNVMKHPIEVIQAEAPVIVLGEEHDGARLRLSYHRHAYGLGEHYNSVVDKSAIPDSDEEGGFT